MITYSPAKKGEPECPKCGNAIVTEHSEDNEELDETFYYYVCKDCGFNFS